MPLVLLAMQAATYGQAFERGKARADSGDVEQAVVVWLLARDSSVAAGTPPDPRIGTAAVQLVAQDGMERYHEAASALFYWGFSGGPAIEPAIRQEILAEGRRTFELVDSTLADSLNRAGVENPTELSMAIKKYWIEHDPRPSTLANERLIEHWRRINYARRQFVHNRNSPYGTDDRGVLYVKYGEPDRVTKGHLGADQSERRLRGVPLEFIARFDRQPQYEIWRYATLYDGEFTYFLFGNTAGTGPFMHVAGLHELIPREARYSSAALYSGIRAQYYLELFYYGDLARMGGPYAQRFSELDRIWNTSRQLSQGSQSARAGAAGVLEAVSRRNVDDDTWASRQPRIPSWSELDDSPKSPLSAQVARIMDGDEARLTVLAVSSPLWRLEPELNVLGDSLVLAPYSARHTVIVRDHQLDEVGRAGMTAADQQHHVSMLTLRHRPELGHLSVVAEHDVQDTLSRSYGLPGHEHFAVGAPLSVAPNSFEVSDLLLGIVPADDSAVVGLPVPLLPATRFWKDDLLRVYFETYNNQSIPTGQSRFYDVRLRVLPTPQPSTDAAGLPTVRLRLESPDRTGRHYLDLDLRNESPGSSWLVLEVTDENETTTHMRTAPLHILGY